MHPHSGASRGYVLLGMIVLLATTMLAVGHAVSVFNQDVEQELRDETQRELDALRDAVERYRLDTGEPPASLADLLVEPAGVESWMGPYVNESFQDFEAVDMGILRDGWGNPYVFESVGAFDLVVRSSGPNGIDDDGAEDDLVAAGDYHDTAWKETVWERRILNTAVTAYNFYPTDPEFLNGGWPGSLNQLQGEGFIPDGNAWSDRLRTDGWGQDYLPDGDPITSINTAGPPQDGGGSPPGQGGSPPGQGGSPPGQGGSPPGQGGSPPGQGGS